LIPEYHPNNERFLGTTRFYGWCRRGVGKSVRPFGYDENFSVQRDFTVNRWGISTIGVLIP
jgi:hypothetical protein